MTNLTDKAEANRPARRAEDLPAAMYRLDDTELVDAEQIGSEDEFPLYGDWIDATEVGRTGDVHGERWLECPAALAQELVDLGVGRGDVFAVQSASKDSDGNWTFAVEQRQPSGQASLEQSAAPDDTDEES